MAENKTKPTTVSVESYLSSIKDDLRRRDCENLVDLMTRVTKEAPKMWGASIVGFGSYHYRYESGREGDSCVTGFSSRSGNISIYLTEDALGRTDLVSKLGKHKAGKGCLYLRRLADVDLQKLEALIAEAVTQRRRSHP